METVLATEHAIEYQEAGEWRQWFASADPDEVEREWRHLQAMQVRAPLRRVRLEVLRDSRTEG